VFEKFGVDGLMKKRMNEVFSVQLKIDAFDYIIKVEIL